VKISKPAVLGPTGSGCGRRRLLAAREEVEDLVEDLLKRRKAG
jgi:hypothetical protein